MPLLSIYGKLPRQQKALIKSNRDKALVLVYSENLFYMQDGSVMIQLKWTHSFAVLSVVSSWSLRSIRSLIKREVNEKTKGKTLTMKITLRCFGLACEQTSSVRSNAFKYLTTYNCTMGRQGNKREELLVPTKIDRKTSKTLPLYKCSMQETLIRFVTTEDRESQLVIDHEISDHLGPRHSCANGMPQRPWVASACPYRHVSTRH